MSSVVVSPTPAAARSPAGVPARPAPRAINRMTRHLCSWLEQVDASAVRTVTGSWTESDWGDFRAAVTIHGLAPHLAGQNLSATAADAFPADVRRWLIEQAQLNGRRIERMHAELALILSRADRAGLSVMPLKGALLTTIAMDGYRRPMADLDLLVRPADRMAMGRLLESLGYRHQPERAPRPTHDVFVDAGGGFVVADGEHPDNPRRVEVHVEVRRHLWGWVDEDDLTAELWTGAERRQVLGQPAFVPTRQSLLSHIAIHATCDLLSRRGRLVQWLDLALVARSADGLSGVPHPRLAYPSLRLAQRALPAALAAVDLDRLASTVPRRLVRWAEEVPLDASCGLSVGRPPDAPASFGARWERWRPERWRLLVAYGDVPLPVALARHAAAVGGRLPEQLRLQRGATAGD